MNMMPSNIVALLFLISCVSMHMYACSAGRLLGFATLEGSGRISHKSLEDVEEIILVKLSEITSSIGKPSISCEEVKDPEALVIPEKASSGHGIIALSISQIDQNKPTELKVLKRQARSLKGSATLHENDMEKVGHSTESKGKSSEAFDEDIGVMDYANPHRKPPIHNEKP